MSASKSRIKTRCGPNLACPVCGLKTKSCSITDNDLVLCRGAPAEKGQLVNGHRCVKGGDEFRCFRAEAGDGASGGAFRGRAKGSGTNGHARRNGEGAAPPIDWSERHRKARERLTPTRLAALAAHLGLPAAALVALEPGYEFHGAPDAARGVYVFPMRDGAGAVCGLHGRDERTGEKKAVYGSKLGVFASPCWKETEGPLCVPEGASDVGALCAMGLPALGRPSARAGAQALADSLLGSDRDVVVLGELDPSTDTGDWPGRDGAIATARRLAAALRRPVDWAFPPGRAKDVRAWFAARGLTHESAADDCHAAGEEFLNGLVRITVAPPPGGADDPDLIQTEDDIPTLADARLAGASKRWAWEPWLQADVLNGLAGEFGHGKTRLVAELIRRVRAGEPWPDGAPMTLPPDSRFLFVPADYQHSELSDLAEKYGFPEQCVFINAMKDNADGVSIFDSVESMACLEKRIAILRPAFVVVDPITAATTTERSHGLAEGGTSLYGPLQRLARKYGTMFLILIHLNKEGGTYGRHAKGKFRTEMTLTKVETGGGERYRLEVTKSNSKKPNPLGAAQQEGRWDFDDSPPEKDAGGGKRGPKPAVDAEAVKFLREFLGGHERKQCEVVDAWVKAGHSTKTIFATAKRMEEDGELLCGEVESPRGRTMLKTWQLAPPASGPGGGGSDDDSAAF